MSEADSLKVHSWPAVCRQASNPEGASSPLGWMAAAGMNRSTKEAVRPPAARPHWLVDLPQAAPRAVGPVAATSRAAERSSQRVDPSAAPCRVAEGCREEGRRRLAVPAVERRRGR